MFHTRLVLHSILVVLLMTFVSVIHAKTIIPFEDNGHVVLFDAAKHGITDLYGQSANWIKDSDLKPMLSLTNQDQQQWVDVTFSGSNGMAQLSMMIDNKDGNIGLPGSKSTGIKLNIDYPHDGYSNIQIVCVFKDQTNLTKTFTLEKSTQDYVITSGYRKAKFPPQWDLLSQVQFRVSGKNDVAKNGFRFSRVELIQEVQAVQKALSIERVRKVAEILPGNGQIKIDGQLDDAVWQDAIALPDYVQFQTNKALTADQSPVQYKLAYDDKNLYIAMSADFPTPPTADVTGTDGAVWQDEALELFFSGDRDNERKIQFVVNAKGAVFDSAVEYDLVTLSNKVRIDRQIKHQKAMQYKDGKWTLEISFPWSELAVNLDKQQFLNFQAALSYMDRPSPYDQPVTWSRTHFDRFFKPLGFGVLVLNKKPFGEGDIEVTSVSKTQGHDMRADFAIECQLKNFTPGNYQLKRTLVDADGKMFELQQAIHINSADQKLSLALESVSNFSGIYTCYLAIINSNGDQRMSAINFENLIEYPDMLGKIVLTPAPKELKYNKGQFLVAQADKLYIASDATPRTRKTAQMFAEKLAGYTGKTLTIQTVANPSSQTDGMIFELASNPPYKAVGQAQEKDGYRLIVEPKRVVITGYGEPGLYYGGQTFVQMLKANMQIKDTWPVPCADIVDWPDVEFRVLDLNHPQLLYPSQQFKDQRGIEYLLQWVDRMTADLKYNVFMVDFSALVKYKRRPEFNGNRTIYSLEDLTKLAEFCRDRFIEPCPQWQTGGHMDWWLLPVHPELRQQGWKHTADVTKPGHDEIVYDCMLDVIEAMDLKYISPKGDEWWHRKMPGETQEELLNGKTRAQVWIDFYNKMSDYMIKRGIRIVIFHDMLNPHHNGKREGLELYKYVDQLSKDIITMEWADRQPAFFLDKGLDVWAVQTGANIFPPNEANRFKGYGKGIYSFGSWLLAHTDPVAVQYEVGPFWAADYAWNIRDYKRGTIKDQLVTGRLVTARNINAIVPNPVASEKIESVNLEGLTNISLNRVMKHYKPNDYVAQDIVAKLPADVTEVGLIPTQFVSSSNDCIMVKSKDASVDIPLVRSCASLIFLHSSISHFTQKEATKKGFNWRQWPYGNPNGKYIVAYEDGSQITVPILSDTNIYWIDTHPLTRTTLDNRYIYSIKDANGKDLQLYQYEWVNPHPDKKITKVTLANDGILDQDVLLFALSTRQVK
jgi:hypothetical protein